MQSGHINDLKKAISSFQMLMEVWIPIVEHDQTVKDKRKKKNALWKAVRMGVQRNKEVE